MKKDKILEMLYNYDTGLYEYMRQVLSIPMLTNQETAELIATGQAGDKEAQKRVIKANLQYVFNFIVNKYNVGADKIQNGDFADWIQSGNMALLEAIENYDPKKGALYQTYASFYIRKEVSACIEKSGVKMLSCELTADMMESLVEPGLTTSEKVLLKAGMEELREVLEVLLAETEYQTLTYMMGYEDGIYHFQHSEAAKHFGVTKQAIAKRIKKIGSILCKNGLIEEICESLQIELPGKAKEFLKQQGLES